MKILSKAAFQAALTMLGLGVITTVCQPAHADGPYHVKEATGNFVPGTTDIGLTGDDDVKNVALPFSFKLYNQNFNSVNVSINGNLQFASDSDELPESGTDSGTCLPLGDPDDYDPFHYTIFAFWQDLRTDQFP